MTSKILSVAFSIFIFMVLIANTPAATLDDVKAKGFLRCGVNQGLIGFSHLDDNDEWIGFDVDYCRGLAAAIFGSGGKVRFTPISSKERFSALQSGEIDVLIRNSTWTMANDTQFGLNVAAMNFIDGLSFMVRKKTKITSPLQLTDVSICIKKGTTTESNVLDYFRSNKLNNKVILFDRADMLPTAYDSGRCDVYTADASALAAQRLKMHNPADHTILPELISKEPLGPVVREGDDQWFNIVKWTHFAMVNAEELGVSQMNIDNMKSSNNPAIKRLTGTAGTFGKGLGLNSNWAADIIREVGNYGEIFNRNVGQDSQLKLPRGMNALWTKGGLLFAPPIR